MQECKHVFEGRADGVHCKACGLHLTAQAYKDYLKPKEEANGQEEPKRAPRKRVQKDG